MPIHGLLALVTRSTIQGIHSQANPASSGLRPENTRCPVEGQDRRYAADATERTVLRNVSVALLPPIPADGSPGILIVTALWPELQDNGRACAPLVPWKGATGIVTLSV